MFLKFFTPQPPIDISGAILLSSISSRPNTSSGYYISLSEMREESNDVTDDVATFFPPYRSFVVLFKQKFLNCTKASNLMNIIINVI
jgi:hypothetical protein